MVASSEQLSEQKLNSIAAANGISVVTKEAKGLHVVSIARIKDSLLYQRSEEALVEKIAVTRVSFFEYKEYGAKIIQGALIGGGVGILAADRLRNSYPEVFYDKMVFLLGGSLFGFFGGLTGAVLGDKKRIMVHNIIWEKNSQ